MSTQYKGLVGDEDLNLWEGAGDASTFTRTTSSGAPVTLTKVGASAAGWNFSKITASEVNATDIIAKGPWIDVRAHGAKPDAADNLAALNAAVAACPVGGTIYFPPADGTYNIGTNTWTIAKSVSVWMGKNTWIGYSGTGTAVDFSATLYRQLVRMNVNNSGAVDWGTATQAGIKFNYAVYNQMYLSAIGFTLGLHWAPTAGNWCNGNTIYLGDLWSNKYAIRQEMGAGVFVNRNVYIGGVISVAADLNPTLDRYAIHLAGSSTNVFTGVDVSLPSPASASSIGLYINGGSGNEFLGIIEGVDTVMLATGEATGNAVRGTVQTAAGVSLLSSAITDTSTTGPGTNVVEWNVAPAPAEGLTEVFSVQDIHRRALANNRSGSNMYYSIPGFSVLVKSDGSYSLFDYDSATAAVMFQGPTYLRLDSTRAIGRLVDTSIQKDFWLNIAKSGTWAPTLVVKSYGAGLVPNTGGTDVVGFSASPATAYALTWNAAAGNYGGAYTCALFETSHIHVSAATKWMWIGIAGDDSTNGGLTGISLKSGANQAAPWSGAGYELVTAGGYDEINQHDLASDRVPIGGVLNNGTRVWHMDAATGEPLGWVATGRTTTLANGGEPAAETAIAVDSITGVSASDIIGLQITKSSDVKWFWSTVNGAPAAGVITITHAIPTGWALADDAQVITYRFLALANLP